MARKLELKTVSVTPNGALANGSDQSSTFSYGPMIRELLRRGPPGGLNFDEVCRSVDALRPIEEAIAAEADHVVLTEDQWRTVRDKLMAFSFGIADQIIVDFGVMIRNAPEIGT